MSSRHHRRRRAPPPPVARTAEEAAALDAELQQLHDQLGVQRGAALSEALKPELITPMPEGLREVAQKAAAPAADPPPAAAPRCRAAAPEDVTNLITLDVSTGQAVVLDALGPVVVNTDGTLARITNWDRMDDSEREVAKRRIAKRNVERLKAFHARGDLKAGRCRRSPARRRAPTGLRRSRRARVENKLEL